MRMHMRQSAVGDVDDTTLLRESGMRGLAYSRLWYGLIPMLVYLPLLRTIRAKSKAERSEPRLAMACQEGSAL